MGTGGVVGLMLQRIPEYGENSHPKASPKTASKFPKNHQSRSEIVGKRCLEQACDDVARRPLTYCGIEKIHCFISMSSISLLLVVKMMRWRW